MTSFFSKKMTRVTEVSEEVPKVTNGTPKPAIAVDTIKNLLTSVNSSETEEIPKALNGKSSPPKNLKGQVEVLAEKTSVLAEKVTGTAKNLKGQVEVLAEKTEVLAEKATETLSFLQKAQSLVVDTGRNTVEAVTRSLTEITNISPVKQVLPVSIQDEDDSLLDVTGQFEFLKSEDCVTKEKFPTTKVIEATKESKELGKEEKIVKEVPKETEKVTNQTDVLGKAQGKVKLLPKDDKEIAKTDIQAEEIKTEKKKEILTVPHELKTEKKSDKTTLPQELKTEKKTETVSVPQELKAEKKQEAATKIVPEQVPVHQEPKKVKTSPKIAENFMDATESASPLKEEKKVLQKEPVDFSLQKDAVLQPRALNFEKVPENAPLLDKIKNQPKSLQTEVKTPPKNLAEDLTNSKISLVAKEETSFSSTTLTEEKPKSPIHTPLTSFEKIREELLKKGKLFVDEDFTREKALLGVAKKEVQNPVVKESDEELERGAIDIIEKGYYKWIRASELCVVPAFLDPEDEEDEEIRTGFHFFTDESSFEAAAVSLSRNQDLFQKVVPLDQNFTDKYAGIFLFRFFKDGSYQDVIVDDFIPERPDYNRGIISYKVFWGILMEKAYAKFLGGYEHLLSRPVTTVLKDLSDGLVETQVLDLDTNAYPSILAASETNSPTVAVKRNAAAGNMFYSVVAAYTTTSTKDGQQELVDLVNVRNSKWEKMPATYAKGSRQWEFLSARLPDCGRWISYEKFVQIFGQVLILRTNTNSKESWTETAFQGEIGLKTSISELKFNDKKSVLQQEAPAYEFIVAPAADAKTQGRKTIIEISRQTTEDVGEDFIGFNLIKIDGTREQFLEGSFGYNREVAKTYELKSGRYILVPLTSTLQKVQFSIRIFVQN